MKANNEQKTRKQTARPTARKFISEPLDKNGFTPMYFQIQTQLMEQIKSGQLRAGDVLPGEDELTQIYGVSRMTLRQALHALTTQGLVCRQRGRGTFILQPKVEKDIAHLLGFSAEMRALGLKSVSRVLGIGSVPALPAIAARLNVETGSPTLHLHRLRSANDVPVAIEEVWLSQDQFPGIEKVDFVRCSLYQTLRERYGIRVGSADEVIEARAASRHEAGLLEIAPKSSLLVISRTLLNVDGQPVETGISLYRGDRYRAVLRIPATAME
ncbi:MAG: GntR family transcriptional regulator [Acidobacteriaceae bacterium]